MRNVGHWIAFQKMGKRHLNHVAEWDAVSINTQTQEQNLKRRQSGLQIPSWMGGMSLWNGWQSGVGSCAKKWNGENRRVKAATLNNINDDHFGTSKRDMKKRNWVIISQMEIGTLSGLGNLMYLLLYSLTIHFKIIKEFTLQDIFKL